MILQRVWTYTSVFPRVSMVCLPVSVSLQTDLLGLTAQSHQPRLHRNQAVMWSVSRRCVCCNRDSCLPIWPIFVYMPNLLNNSGSGSSSPDFDGDDNIGWWSCLGRCCMLVLHLTVSWREGRWWWWSAFSNTADWFSLFIVRINNGKYTWLWMVSVSDRVCQSQAVKNAGPSCTDCVFFNHFLSVERLLLP